MKQGFRGTSVLCVITLAGLAVACSGGPGASSLAAPTASTASEVSHGLELTAFAGSGGGSVNVSANARGGEFTVNTRDAIHVYGVTPNTVLYVRAAADVGLPGGQQNDGVCQRAALGQFMPLNAFPGGPGATIETSAGGAGATRIIFGATNPFLSDGGSLDLVIRLVDALPPAIPTIDLRTECFTQVVK
jgi:hypothetical protein